MNAMNQRATKPFCSRSSRKPHARGVLIDFDAGPSRRAILFLAPEPEAEADES